MAGRCSCRRATRSGLILRSCLVVMAIGLTGCGASSGPAPGPIVFAGHPGDELGGGYNNLMVMNPDGSGVRRLTRTDGDVAPSWSPDGTQVVFERATKSRAVTSRLRADLDRRRRWDRRAAADVGFGAERGAGLVAGRRPHRVPTMERTRLEIDIYRDERGRLRPPAADGRVRAGTRIPRGHPTANASCFRRRLMSRYETGS